LSSDELDAVLKLVNRQLLDDILEERISQGRCSNLKCASQVKKGNYCAQSACQKAVEDLKKRVESQDSLYSESYESL
jgi:hypothetical protein